MGSHLRDIQYADSMVEACQDSLIALNSDGKIMDSNIAFSLLTGKKGSALKGTDFNSYFTTPESVLQLYRKIYEEGPILNYPVCLKSQNGLTVDALINGTVFKGSDDTVLGLVIVVRDVSEQNANSTKLTDAIVMAELATAVAEEAKVKADEARDVAEDAVKSKQQFLSNMSHEIRTPMNAIIGFTKVVLKTGLSPKQKEYLTAIKTSGDALIVLINDILDLSKVDAGKMDFEEVPFKISNSISAILHLFELKTQEKNLKLIQEYDQKIPEVLLGDPIRLHQIILNLVGNAVKFTKEGAITMTAHLIKEDEEMVTIEFVIADTGIGIDKEKFPHIFENFQQATSETSRLFGGTGLGLAIVKKLVEGQGGSITVKSEINKGSAFHFTLNFRKTNEAAASEPEPTELSTHIKNVTVLVVEDLPLNQLLMKTILEDFGFECDIAINGKIAVEKVQNKVYDIILMDLQMPEMDGFEATTYIRKHLNTEIPIIALTADVTTADLARCRTAGMNDYISKPLDERLLKTKMIFLLRKAALKIHKQVPKVEVTTNKKYTNLQYLIQRTKSDPLLMSEMISLYLGQTKGLIKDMEESFQNKNWKALHAVAHKMIPSFSIVGIEAEYELLAEKLQELAKKEQHEDEMKSIILQLTKVLKYACIELGVEMNLINNKQ